jgi:predicted MFS family arabinose efflux permease
MADAQTRWDTSYEWKATTLLGLGFGLVGLDRWIIAPLLPTMTKDLGLSVQQAGNLIGALGLVWGVFAIISGRLSDTIGHRKILIPSILLFSLMSGFSGMATGFVSLLSIRALMGLMEGSYCPTSFAATAAAAHPSRRGFLQGLQQSGFALFGFGLGPIIATQLLLVVPSWRWVFWAVAIPGIIVGILMAVVLREPGQTQGGKLVGEVPAGHGDTAAWGSVLKSKNIVLCMLALFCAMSCIFVLGGLLPTYLTDAPVMGNKLSPQEIGFVASALGFGGFVGQFGVPGISDVLGRRLTAVLAFLGAAITLWFFMQLGPNPATLFGVLFLVSFFSLGNVALITGPISTESAPVGLISSAIGLVVGAGEIFGGGVAPSIAGFVGQNYGIQNILWMPLVGVVLGVVVCAFLKETAPRKLRAGLPGAIVAVAAIVVVGAGSASAQVPENIYQGMLKIGQVVDPSCTAKLYRPLMPANDYNSNVTPLYPGITIQRDLSFGPNPKDLVDVFTADKGGGSRPVVIYVPGGGGNKIEQQVREGNAFYDNIGRWATKNGMVGVLMQRHPGQNWDDPAKDVSLVIQWLQANIAKYKGNANRMFIWAHSAGNGPLGTYIGRPELYGPKGVGVKGAILMSGQWNVAPLMTPGVGTGRGAGGAAGASGAVAPSPAGSTCGAGGPTAGDGAIVGPSGMTPPAGRSGPAPGASGPAAGAARGVGPAPGTPGLGTGAGGTGAGRGRGAPVDAETQLARSALPELRKTKVALLFASAELDPGINGTMSDFYQTLHDDLCRIGKAQCPTMLFGKRQNHMSEVFSIDTADASVSGPILAWMKKVK